MSKARKLILKVMKHRLGNSDSREEEEQTTENSTRVMLPGKTPLGPDWNQTRVSNRNEEASGRQDVIGEFQSKADPIVNMASTVY